MNRKKKERLGRAFLPPKPTKKAAFLSALPYPKTRYIDFLLGQAGFIRKRVWLLSLLAAGLGLLLPRLLTGANSKDALWILSSFLPFLALAGITELARSAAHNMEELEMSCRYSYSHVVLARLGILGAANLVVFIPAAILFLGQEPATGLALFLPFLLTCALSLAALSRLRSRECVYLSGAVALAVSAANLVTRGAYVPIGRLPLSALAFFALLFWIALETRGLLRKSEEYAWNLS